MDRKTARNINDTLQLLRRYPGGNRLTQDILQEGEQPADKPHIGMIQLTRINKLQLVLNADLIEHIEATPDTVIQLTNGQKLVVLESADEIVRRVIEYRRKLHFPAPAAPDRE